MTRPRIRTIKPELWHDEKVGALSRDARLLFIGLITMADDEGRLRGAPTLVLGHVFPYDNDAAKKLERWLGEIENAGLVVRYTHNGLPYVAIKRWKRNQKINRAQPSELPAPPDLELVESNQVDEVDRSSYRKGAIPERTRREVARRAGCEPGETAQAPCHWCGTVGTIVWARLSNGRPGSWVQFKGLELDHLQPEVHGGSSEPENIVLACTTCNRTRGHRNGTGAPYRKSTESRTSDARKSVPDANGIT